VGLVLRRRNAAVAGRRLIEDPELRLPAASVAISTIAATAARRAGPPRLRRDRCTYVPLAIQKTELRRRTVSDRSAA